jgi:tetratricopeptide (TPR) repeat protein
MKKTVLALFVLAALTAAAYAQTAAECIRAGDEAYAQFNDQKALTDYLEALKTEPANYEALWKASRAYVDIADLMPASDKEAKQNQMKMYSDGVTYAKKAVAANPDDTWGHFMVSAAMGKKLLMQGKKEQIDGSKEVKAQIDRALELDPNNDLAWHALGRWQRRMAEIGGAKRFFGSIIYGSIPKGSFEESEKDLQKAVELNPTFINHHLELGRTYVSLKKYDLARQEFDKCLQLPVSTSKDGKLKKEAEAELADLQGKK